MQNSFTRMMIEVAVDKALGEIRKKSKRALRNLADLGMHYAKGRFQDEFFTIAQHMLEDDNSPYYDMFFHLANNVDPKMLKKFGINLGYNAWTAGAKTIRKWEQERGYHVPWTVVFNWENLSEHEMLSEEEIQRNISQAKEMGIYCYMFFVGANQEVFNSLLKVFAHNDDCAFLCFCETPLITSNLAIQLRKMGNTMPVVEISPTQRKETERACEILLEEECLFSLWVSYDDEMIPEIWKRYREPQEKSICSFVFFIRKENCSDEAADKLHELVDEGQETPQSTLFPIDFYEDISHVDRKISKEDCYLEIQSNDRALFGNKLIEFRQGIDFQALLQTYMPRVQFE